MALWSARFSQKADTRLEEFNASIDVDQNMVQQDIQGSIAHVTMLAKQGIVTEKESKVIIETLQTILKEIESGELIIDPQAEDIHMFVEGELTKRTELGKKLHTARSRNDQVALDFKLYAMNECVAIEKLLVNWLEVLMEQAQDNLETIMPGYTHLQRAQPITFAHHLMAYVEMFKRDLSRLQDARKRCNQNPLGSGALATTTYNIDREFTSKLLGFNNPTYNSLDSVSDRDFAIEMVHDYSLIMMHLSRLCEEIILWCSWEFRFIELSDTFSTGSSIMPQKKNPDVAELVRGKTGRVYGHLQALLTMMKGLPLAYNKDLQEDKEAFMDSAKTVKDCLVTMIPMVQTWSVKKDNMRQAAATGFINATDCADYLVKKGLAFRDAYTIVGNLVRTCTEKKTTLEELSLEEYKEIDETFDQDVYEAISLDTCVNQRKVLGGPAPQCVQEHINEVKKELSAYES